MDYTIITEPYEIIYILGEPPHTLLEGTYSNRKEKKWIRSDVITL